MKVNKGPKPVSSESEGTPGFSWVQHKGSSFPTGRYGFSRADGSRHGEDGKAAEHGASPRDRKQGGTGQFGSHEPTNALGTSAGSSVLCN